MTKFILVGGYPHKGLGGGKAFCQELVKGFDQPVTILDCLFARPRENWLDAFEQDKAFFTRHLPDTKLNLVLADSDNFLDQLESCDAVYFRGGSTVQLISELQKITGWTDKLVGKTVAGSSAGSDMLAKYYYELDEKQLGKGIGLVQVKSLPHYRSDYDAPNIDWDKVETELDEYMERLPLAALGEGEFRVYTL